jgi:hypothetical protein
VTWISGLCWVSNCFTPMFSLCHLVTRTGVTTILSFIILDGTLGFIQVHFSVQYILCRGIQQHKYYILHPITTWPSRGNGTHWSWSTNLIIVPFRNVPLKERSRANNHGHQHKLPRLQTTNYRGGPDAWHSAFKRRLEKLQQSSGRTLLHAQRKWQEWCHTLIAGESCPVNLYWLPIADYASQRLGTRGADRGPGCCSKQKYMWWWRGL